MDEHEEKTLANLLARAVDGAGGVDVIPGGSGSGDAATVALREAEETARFLSAGLEVAPGLDSTFDRKLRARLAAEASRMSPKVVPIYKNTWFSATLSAAMLMLMLTPYYWFYMRPRSVELQTTYRIKQERVEKYDKLYVSKLSELRKNLEKGEAGNPPGGEYFKVRRESRVRALISRQKARQALENRPAGGGGAM